MVSLPSHDRASTLTARTHPETQVVAGRWRAIARAHAKTLSGQEAIADLHVRLNTCVAEILFLSGAAGTAREILDVVQTLHAERLRSFLGTCLELNKAVGEDIVSADFEVIAVDCGSHFEKETMKDEWNSTVSEGAAGTVLCTIAVGLRRTEKQDNGDLRAVALLKPGVALDSIVSELMCA